MPRYRAVLFDLDGTLLDTAPDLAGAVNRMRIVRGLPALPLVDLQAMASHGARGLLQAGFAIGPEHAEFAAMRDEFLRNYTESICLHTRLFDGVGPLLQALEQGGLAWGIVTNKVEALTLRLLEQLRLQPAPHCVIGGDSAAKPKPAADPLLLAAARMGLAAQDCLYLGDDLRDIQAARAAGMDCMAAGWGYLAGQDPHAWGADRVLERPAELLELLALR